jgi:hypothetical protein
VVQLVKKITDFMEPKGSLPHLQVPTTCPYPKPVHFSPFPPTSHFLKIHLNYILPFTPGSPQWSLTLRFPHPNPVYTSPPPIRATCADHLILLDFITLTIMSEEYKSLYSFLHSLVTSSLLGSDIPSTPLISICS